MKNLTLQPMGMPLFLLPPEALAHLPEAARCRLEARARASREKMQAAQQRFSDSRVDSPSFTASDQERELEDFREQLRVAKWSKPHDPRLARIEDELNGVKRPLSYLNSLSLWGTASSWGQMMRQPDGRLAAFAEGSFTDTANCILQWTHDPRAEALCTPEDGFQVFQNETGLHFEAPKIRDTFDGTDLFRDIASRYGRCSNRTTSMSCSVSGRIADAHEENWYGETVEVVDRFELKHIALLPNDIEPGSKFTSVFATLNF